LRRYLEENIDYTLDAENLRGLGKYFSYAAELGIIPEVRKIVRAAEVGARGPHSDFFAARRH
jgi:hypothetical protein